LGLLNDGCNVRLLESSEEKISTKKHFWVFCFVPSRTTLLMEGSRRAEENDISLISPHASYVWELKHHKEKIHDRTAERKQLCRLAEDAINQINSRKYYQGVSGTRCVFVGAAFHKHDVAIIYEECEMQEETVLSISKLVHKRNRTFILEMSDGFRMEKTVESAASCDVVGLFSSLDFE